MTSSLSANQPLLWDEFDLLSRTITATLADTLRPYEVSHSDWGILKLIATHNDSELRVKTIRNAARTESSRLAHQLKRLEDRGLIARSRSATDGRGTVVCLTSAGWRSYHQMLPQVDQALNRLLVQLDESTVQLLAGILGRINRSNALHAEQHLAINLRAAGTTDQQDSPHRGT